jgi:hypothetical protein
MVERGEVMPGIMVNPSSGPQRGCFWCGDVMDILLFGGTRDESKRRFKQREILVKPVYESAGSAYEPCSECAGVMNRGVSLLEIADGNLPTGRYWVLSPEALPRIVLDQTLCYRIVVAGKAYIHREDAKRVGLFNAGVNG